MVDGYRHPRGTDTLTGKAAIVTGGSRGIGEAIVLDLASRGVRVNVVAPGYVDTDMVAAVPPATLAPLIAGIPMKRMERSDEVARVVSFLLSAAASYITGAVVPVDGGHGA